MKRWLVLIATLANIVFNGIYTKLTTLPPINIISDKYSNLFTPAGYAFAIWGIIYLSFIVYAIYQLLSKQRRNTTYDRLAIPFILINLLGSLWIISFTAEMLTISILIMMATLITAIIAFQIAQKAIIRKDVKSKWQIIPFSLFVGWISVATIANFSAWFVSMGWRGGALGEITWTIIMILIAGILGIIFSYNQRNSIYAFVISWALLAIFVARKNTNDDIAYVALSIAALMAVAGIINLVKPKRFNHSYALLLTFVLPALVLHFE